MPDDVRHPAIDKSHLPLSSSVKDPAVYPVVEAALGIPVASYALG